MTGETLVETYVPVQRSCKDRGVCPSCNARGLAEREVHLLDEVFPRLPVCQCVLTAPKRLRYFWGAPAGTVCARGSREVSFVQRFGALSNPHVHFHCCVICAVFATGKECQVRFAWPGAPRLE